MTRTIAYVGLACAVLAFAVAMCQGVTHAQCMCPAPSEPPVTWVGLPKVEPGGGYVFLAWVTR